MPIYRMYPTKDEKPAGPEIIIDLPDDTAALMGALDVATGDHCADAWEGQRLVVVLPPMPREKPSEPS